ncbi:MAG: FkbM family methyltransferase [Salinirussus sp.]|jgi:FkbM family methyltransferase
MFRARQTPQLPAHYGRGGCAGPRRCCGLVVERHNGRPAVRSTVSVAGWDGRLRGALDRVAARLRWVGYRTYFRLVRYNYRQRLLARPNWTPAGRFWSYELLNRYRNNSMLAAIDTFCGPDAVVYDVGANVGMYAAALAVAAPRRRVLAFEPAPTTAEQLRANLARNGIDDRVEVHDYGLGATDGRRQFHVSTYPELSGFDRESATRWEATVAETVPVQVRRLDDVAETAPPPDVVKLDVEGAGPAVLAGGRETLHEHRPALFVEPHAEQLPDDPTTAMRTRLEDLDYRVEDRGEFWRCLPARTT